MALVGDDLGVAIKDAVIAEFAIAPVNQTDLVRWADAVGNAIVTYIKANAELDAAALDDDAVTGTTDTTVSSPSQALDGGAVTTSTVSGGIK